MDIGMAAKGELEVKGMEATSVEKVMRRDALQQGY